MVPQSEQQSPRPTSSRWLRPLGPSPRQLLQQPMGGIEGPLLDTARGCWGKHIFWLHNRQQLVHLLWQKQQRCLVEDRTWQPDQKLQRHATPNCRPKRLQGDGHHQPGEHRLRGHHHHRAEVGGGPSSDPARPNELWGWAILAQTTGEEAWQHGLHTKSFVFCGHLSGGGGFHQQSIPEQGLRLTWGARLGDSAKCQWSHDIMDDKRRTEGNHISNNIHISGTSPFSQKDPGKKMKIKYLHTADGLQQIRLVVRFWPVETFWLVQVAITTPHQRCAKTFNWPLFMPFHASRSPGSMLFTNLMRYALYSG